MKDKKSRPDVEPTVTLPAALVSELLTYLANQRLGDVLSLFSRLAAEVKRQSPPKTDMPVPQGPEKK